MSKRSILWINTPVIMEAIIRYNENRLPRPMRLWLEKVLDINTNDKPSLILEIPH